jgi:hypothetical protein
MIPANKGVPSVPRPTRASCPRSIWYLTTDLAHEQTQLSEIVRLYGLPNWVEQSYKQMKGELSWADFMVRKDHAIRGHWELVCCAFFFCRWCSDCRWRVSDEQSSKRSA